MLSFTNTIETKEQAVANAIFHRDHDMLIKGTYQQGTGKEFKGCSVGCTYNAYEGKVDAANLHALSAPVHGIPEWLTRLRDTLFEGVSDARRNNFHVEFFEAIPIGIDEITFEKKVKAPFLILILESALTSFDHAKFPDAKAAIDGSIALWQRDDIGSEDWNKAAEAAAGAAARAAGAAGAAETAAWAAARAAWAAEAAAGAARAAARAAWAAGAAGAAEAEKMDYFADELIKLLKALN